MSSLLFFKGSTDKISYNPSFKNTPYTTKPFQPKEALEQKTFIFSFLITIYLSKMTWGFI